MGNQNTTENFDSINSLALFDLTRGRGVMNREAAERILAEEMSALRERFGTTTSTPQELAVSTTTSVTYV